VGVCGVPSSCCCWGVECHFWFGDTNRVTGACVMSSLHGDADLQFMRHTCVHRP
jgi:hypothetical protein